MIGEHAAVYARPAIAAPVTDVAVRATISARPNAPSGEIKIEAPAVGLDARLSELPDDQPIAWIIHLVQRAIQVKRLPAMQIKITSTIPPAAGLGSSAAVAVALIRALTQFLGYPLDEMTVCQLAYESEKRQHGSPSGVDNTVITYARPIYFVKGQPFEALNVAEPVHLLIADSGQPSSTAEVVADVRRGWEKSPAAFDAIFDAIGSLAQQARLCIENGPAKSLGALLNQNHQLLQQLGVSNPKLDRLVEAAIEAGALGGKLSGGGRGGNLIAQVEEAAADHVTNALLKTGAVRVISTTIHPNRNNLL